MSPLYPIAVLFAYSTLQAYCNPLRAQYALTIDNNAERTSQLQSDPANMLSLVTRYTGMGYNLLMANPEGDFYRAAIDPGIKATRFIFKHTYKNRLQAFYNGASMQLPDQVEFKQLHSCAQARTTNAYSGQTSYRNELDVNVKTSGKWSIADTKPDPLIIWF